MNFRLSRLAPVALTLAAGLMTACKGTDYWLDQVRADPLYQRAEKVVISPSCSGLVPMEFGRSFPVPVRDAQKQFEILFYPLSVAPGKSEVFSPVFEAHFARDTAAADVCLRLPKAEARSLGAAVPAGLSNKAYYRAEATLFASLDRTAAVYFAGGASAPADKAALGEFIDAFLTLAEPGLRPDYYRINPDFWEWLRRETGRSIPKPG
jgi:hypothetical protein